MNYIQITVATSNEELHDIITALLSENNYEGFETTELELRAFIAEEMFNEDELKQILNPLNLTYSKQVIAKQNWNELWESNFHPVLVDDFVGIRAHFHETLKNVEHEIIITPKMSFGTGHHATTFTVMQLMKEIDFNNKTVFDFGTGTGILAILAEKLGAKEILAIDYDEWCIENSLENITANNCTKIEIMKADTAKTTKAFDVVLANINKNIILNNITAISKATAQKGKLILSGLLKDDEKEILDTVSDFGFNHLKTKEKNNWIAILLEKI